MTGDTFLFCHKCSRQLTPGEGNFYIVRIEAFADPAPQSGDLHGQQEIDTRAEIERLLDEMRDMSERELMDQVYRRLTIHLCGQCYRTWIENPAGR
jgi:hypothetical protein